MLEILDRLPSLNFAQTASTLGISEAAVKKLIEAGELKTIVLPLRKRPRVLSISVRAAHERIYGVETQPA
jgi:hypothetical protein